MDCAAGIVLRTWKRIRRNCPWGSPSGGRDHCVAGQIIVKQRDLPGGSKTSEDRVADAARRSQGRLPRGGDI